MIECRGLNASYGKGRQARHVLRDFTWNTSANFVAIMGPSGSGKSTLLRLLSGSQVATSGTVTISGRAIRQRSGQVDDRVGVIFQDYRLVDFLSVAENLQLAAELHGQAPSVTRVDEVLEMLGIAEHKNSQTTAISGGEQQRVAIARALILQPEIIVADEPTGALDQQNSEHIGSLLQKVSRGGHVKVIMATHDRNMAAFADELYTIGADQMVRA